MKRPCCFFQRAIAPLLFVFLLAFQANTLRAEVLRIAVFGSPDEKALVEAGLADSEGVEVLERTAAQTLQAERILSMETISPLALNEELAADLFLLVEPGGDALDWGLLLVNARDGREIGRTLNIPRQQLKDVAATLLKNASKKHPPNSASVVILESEDPEARAVGQAIRELLTGLGLEILDRSLTWQVLEERLGQQSGFRKEVEALTVFSEAQRIITVESAGKDRVLIKAMANDGSVLGVFEWSPHEADPEFLQRSLLPLFADGGYGAVSPYQQRVGMEALLPFYRGVTACSSGDPLGALVEFGKAREANNRFVAAYQWEQRCYEALGLPEFSSAVQRWLETGLEGRGVAAGDAISTREGVTFLGVRSTAETNERSAMRWETEALRHLGGPGLLLPSSMVAVARELDFLAAASSGDVLSSEEGQASASSPRFEWSTADGFTTRFTLRGELAGENITWILADDLSGKVIAREEMATAIPPSEVSATLGQTLERLLQKRGEAGDAVVLATGSLPPPDKALQTIKSSADQTTKMAAGLALLLQEPNHPAVLALRWGSTRGSDGLLGDYLDHAKRDVLLRLLPTDDPLRPWVELQTLQTFLPAIAAGPHLSGETRDGLADLKSFSERYRDHPAGVLARFFWLTDIQSAISPQDVVAEARQLAPRMRSASEVPQNQRLASMCDAMEWLGRAAAGEPGMVLDPEQVTPCAYRMDFDSDGKIRIEYVDNWGVQDFRKFDLSPEEIQLEAKAALAIGGRSMRRKNVEPDWLEHFAVTFSLASWIGWHCIHEFSHGDGQPHAHTGDHIAWKNHHAKMIRVAVDGLTKWMNRVQNQEQFRAVDAPIHRLVPALGAPAHNLSPEEFSAFHRQLTSSASRAAARLGVPDRSPRSYGLYQLDWRDVTWEEIQRQGEVNLYGPPDFMRDLPSFLHALHEHGQEAFVAEIPSIRNWWEQTNWGLDSSMSNRDIATQLILPFYQAILRTYGHGPLSDDERALLLDTGILLMWGWRYPEAETLFQLALEAPPSITSVEGTRRALRATAMFHQARLQIQAQNKPEAIRLLREVLTESADLEIRMLLRMHRNFRNELLRAPGQRENLGSLAVRLLEELRFDPALAKLPEGTFALQIQTTQRENPCVTIFYRLPSNLQKDAPILICLPSFNHGGLEIFEDGSPWTKFADEHGFLLVVPQFFQSHTVWNAEHPCAPYHFPQIWSGPALLSALDQIRTTHKIENTKFFFHGRGAGAQCAARFARWRPDLIAGLSLHTGAYYPWRESEPGLQSLHVYHEMPILLTAGAKEDHGASSNGRRYNAEIFQTVLRGAGAKVDFHLLDSTFHRPSPQEQDLAEAFFINYNHISKTNQ